MERERWTPFLRQCLVTAAVCSNVIGCGCEFGFPGILLPQLNSPGSPIQVSDAQASWLTSASSVTMIVGNFVLPAVMLRGRKLALYAVTLTMILGWLAIVLGNSYEMLLIGCMIQGLSNGIFIPLKSVFLGECTSPRYRGGFLTTCLLAQTFGILFVHLIGSFISYQLTALCASSFSVISLLLAIYIPESPSWLAMQGQYEQCIKNFIWLRGEEETPELEKLIQTTQLQEPTQNKLKEIIYTVKKKEFYKPVCLMFALYTMVVHSGGLVMAVYPTQVLHLLLGPTIDANVWMIALDCQRIFFGCVAIYVINKVKRRKMLFSTGALCAGSQLFMGAYLYAKNGGVLSDTLWLPALLINLQMLAVSMGMKPLPVVIAGEVFPLQLRGLAASIGVVAQCSSAFIILKTFPYLTSVIGLEGTLTVYAAVVASCLGVAWALLPETSGRTLQQIEEHFRGFHEGSGETEPLIGREGNVYNTVDLMSIRKQIG